MAYGALVHLSNILSLSGRDWELTPASWRAADVAYALIDLAAMAGLWCRRRWGVALFAAAVLSQLVLCTAFLRHFATTPDARLTVLSLVVIEGLLSLTLLVLVRRRW